MDNSPFLRTCPSEHESPVGSLETKVKGPNKSGKSRSPLKAHNVYECIEGFEKFRRKETHSTKPYPKSQEPRIRFTFCFVFLI